MNKQQTSNSDATSETSSRMRHYRAGSQNPESSDKPSEQARC